MWIYYQLLHWNMIVYDPASITHIFLGSNIILSHSLLEGFVRIRRRPDIPWTKGLIDRQAVPRSNELRWFSFDQPKCLSSQDKESGPVHYHPFICIKHASISDVRVFCGNLNWLTCIHKFLRHPLTRFMVKVCDKNGI